METMAEAVLSVLEQLNIESAHFIGHSMGGYVILALAEMNPELFKGLCLMNSTFEADDEELKVKRTNANKMAQTHFENLVRLSFANLFASESRIKYKEEYNNALNIALKTTIQGYIAGQEGMKLRPNRLTILKALDAHKLIIIGKKDAVVNKDSIISEIEETDIDFIELSEGHMSHIENKSDLSYYLMRFVEK
jgi:pimeloyl-ACP methyl ester carboxylesterase